MCIRWLAIGCVAVVGLTGCPSYSTMGLARPLRKGSMQTVVSPEAQGVASGLTVVWPQTELGVRYGVTDSFELGIKAWLFGLALEGKIGLLESPTMESGVDLSFNPSASYMGIGWGFGGVNLITVSLPLLVGFNFGGNQLVLGPKLVDHMVIAGGVGNLLNVGLSLGYAIKLGDEFRLMPEISATTPIFGQAGSAVGFGFVPGAMVHVGIGIMFGGKYESAPAPLAP
jgi:hypothetical protein